MKNRTYLPVIAHAKAKGCTVEMGSKHAKVFSPTGKLLVVLSVNGSKECGNVASTLRRIDKGLAT